ncbi:MAG: hypothetical protein IKO85_04950 [Bacteroidaceae bacterium]|nr:hypothetical protein [Bacteroidaceae bacterium]
MNKIGFIVEDRDVAPNGVVHLSIRMLNSDKPQLTTNELPIILNALKHSQLMDAEVQVGFDYTLDFEMEAGFGFPHVLDFELLDENDRKIV